MATFQTTGIPSLDRCPVTGLPITHSPRWMFSAGGAKPYSAEFSLIGDHIIHASVNGYSTLDISKRYLDLLETVCLEVLPDHGKFIFLEDYSAHHGTSSEARNYYINRQKRNEHLAGVIFFSVSPFFATVIRVSRMFVHVPYAIEVAPDYTAAIRLALSIKEKAPVDRPANPVAPAPSPGPWKLDSGGYTVDFQVLPGSVLLSKTSGTMKTTQEVDAFETVYRRIFREWFPPGGSFYRLMDWTALRHVSWKARGYYMQRLRQLQKEFPCRMAVLYGLGPFVRTLYSVSRHFLPIPIVTARNLEESLELIRKHASANPALFQEPVPGPAALLTPEEVDRQIRLLIDLMAAINWEQSGVPITEAMLEKAGPFRPLYEALFIFKQDYDEITQTQRESDAKRREIEEQLHHAEKMQTIGTLAGGIAHDFNNMLGGITGFASLLQKRYGGLDPAIDRYAGMILDTGKRAGTLIESLLIFARKGRRETVAIDTHDLLKNLVALLSHTLDKNIQISLEWNAGNPVILGDPSQIQNSLLNLAVNAADAMPRGGKLVIAARRVSLDDAAIAQLVYPVSAGPYLEISLSDTGIGIPPEIRGRIFEPFFTTKETGKGTGLGLASVYGTLQGHNAGIALESEPGRGTTFHLYFKAATPAAQGDTRSQAAAMAAGSGRILAVDDEPAMLGVVQEMLADLGYEVTACVDGLEAVEAFEKNPHAFVLVLLDLVMPRMGGEECFQKLKKLNPDIKVILTTGYSGHTQVNSMLAQGAAGLLPKPYTLEALAEILQKTLKPV